MLLGCRERFLGGVERLGCGGAGGFRPERARIGFRELFRRRRTFAVPVKRGEFAREPLHPLRLIGERALDLVLARGEIGERRRRVGEQLLALPDLVFRFGEARARGFLAALALFCLDRKRVLFMREPRQHAACVLGERAFAL